MSSQLQKQWSLAELARFRADVSGRVPMAACERLKALQNGFDKAKWLLSVRFCRPECRQQPGQPALVGTATTLLKLRCERCLEQFDYGLETSFDVVFVASIGARQDGPDFDFWELGAGTVRLADVIEEYLLLALPMAVKHADADCAGASVPVFEPSAETLGRETHNPFGDCVRHEKAR